MDNIAGLLQALSASPERIIYRQWADQAWHDYRVDDVLKRAARWQASFRTHGFERGERIAICLRNSVEWVAIDQAALGFGLVIVPLYADDNAENIAWCISDSGARLLVLENARILKALQNTGAALPPILTLNPELDAPAVFADHWLTQSEGDFHVEPLAPDALATIVYTSGTSGRPKGVELTHQNILHNVAGIIERVRFTRDDHFLSLLPLSHMFERTCGFYVPLAGGGAVVSFSRGVSQLADDLAHERPSILIAVPRVFERFVARIESALESSRFKKALFKLAVSSGARRASGRANLFDRFVAPFLQRRVARPILAKLGGRLSLTVVGGAKLDARIARVLVGLGLQTVHGYGMTEASPVISATDQDGDDLESVGRLFPGLEARLDEQGALHVRGPSIMRGYWQNPAATAAVLKDGWLNTGDVAEMRGERIYIRGRIKDIMVLSNGEKFPPQDAENAILADPLFEQAILVGEGQSFISLLAVTRERDEKKLTAAANARLSAFPRYVRVRRVIALDEPWTIENGLLTPTLKIKRAVVTERYRREIEAIYQRAD